MGDQCIVFKVEENQNLDELDELELDLGTLDNEDWEESFSNPKTDDEVIFFNIVCITRFPGLPLKI